MDHMGLVCGSSGRTIDCVRVNVLWQCRGPTPMQMRHLRKYEPGEKLETMAERVFRRFP